MKICDCHNDFLTELKSEKEKINYIKNEILNNKNIKNIGCVIWTTELNKPIEFINNNMKLIKEIKDKNKKLLICFEDMNFVVTNNLINYKILNYILKLNIFSCGLVWNFDNNLGGGALGKSGLTNLGKLLVKILESNNILIDTAHMNKKTFYDFVKITTKPIYNSHSNIYTLKKHKRNLTDKQIKTIINSKGFIGLSFVQNFISDKIVDCNKVALQIKYFADKFGIDNVGFGSDFYGTKNLPIDLKTYSNFKNLKKSLKNVGFSYIQIKKIFFKNFLKFKNRVKK